MTDKTYKKIDSETLEETEVVKRNLSKVRLMHKKEAAEMQIADGQKRLTEINAKLKLLK